MVTSGVPVLSSAVYRVRSRSGRWKAFPVRRGTLDRDTVRRQEGLGGPDSARERRRVAAGEVRGGECVVPLSVYGLRCARWSARGPPRGHGGGRCRRVLRVEQPSQPVGVPVPAVTWAARASDQTHARVGSARPVRPVQSSVIAETTVDSSSIRRTYSDSHCSRDSIARRHRRVGL